MGSNPFGHCWAQSRGPGASTNIFEFFEIIVGNKRGLSCGENYYGGKNTTERLIPEP
jgi:hypothetical protein